MKIVNNIKIVTFSWYSGLSVSTSVLEIILKSSMEVRKSWSFYFKTVNEVFSFEALNFVTKNLFKSWVLWTYKARHLWNCYSLCFSSKMDSYGAPTTIFNIQYRSYSVPKYWILRTWQTSKHKTVKSIPSCFPSKLFKRSPKRPSFIYFV